ncbi:hypothetical protein [Pedobacter sp. GR22-6]|uniref:hypothetical protein n=1 Tax=Pedobacter sp. GR22-6 TaxID=3127957 RepID=UPI00307E2FCD
MQLSVYVIYELLIRLQELNPAVGEYLSYKKISAGIKVQTTTGSLEFPDTMLDQQFHHPESVAPADLNLLLGSFKPNTSATPR